VHTDAASAERTDWSQIVALYDQLLAYMPTSIVALNRAIAVAELRGPAAALPLVDQLDLDAHHLYHASRADLLERLDRPDEARVAYDRALTLVSNEAERRHLERRRAAVTPNR
jgi:RNA polymerase sigma-70 factor, ECF subfamily